MSIAIQVARAIADNATIACRDRRVSLGLPVPDLSSQRMRHPAPVQTLRGVIITDEACRCAPAEFTF